MWEKAGYVKATVRGANEGATRERETKPAKNQVLEQCGNSFTYFQKEGDCVAASSISDPTNSNEDDDEYCKMRTNPLDFKRRIILVGVK